MAIFVYTRDSNTIIDPLETKCIYSFGLWFSNFPFEYPTSTLLQHYSVFVRGMLRCGLLPFLKYHFREVWSFFPFDLNLNSSFYSGASRQSRREMYIYLTSKHVENLCTLSLQNVYEFVIVNELFLMDSCRSMFYSWTVEHRRES